MNITIITSEKLQEFPPAISLLQVLEKLGHMVTFISPYRDTFFEEMELQHGTHFYIRAALPEFMTKYHRSRLKGSLAFRSERLIRKMCLRRIPQRFTKQIQSADVVWILNENTTFLGGKGFVDRLGTYMQTMYELHIKNGKSFKMYDYAADRAALMVVPEYCRAHITKAFYGLTEMPAIIPNKPLEHPRERNLPVSDPVIAEKIAKLKADGKKIIMYMGILSDERPLEPIIEAANQTEDYVLAVLGARTPYLDRLEQTMGGRFEYLGVVKPPHHLEVASHADVAYISYVANNHSINAVFCAPNKVYEFAGFGIPMLCNDNPGLKFTVEYYGMGVCAADLEPQTIKSCLDHIRQREADMQAAAERYYDEESMEKTVEQTLLRYMELKEGRASCSH